jgi:hypothetical protein
MRTSPQESPLSDDAFCFKKNAESDISHNVPEYSWCKEEPLLAFDADKTTIIHLERYSELISDTSF